MKLYFFYGPPAVGKLTIAQEVAKQTGVPLFDNHAIINPVYRIFGWEHPERKRLVDEIRLEIFRTAAMSGISLITTFGGGGEKYNAYIQQVIAEVEGSGGEVVFVRFMAPKEVLYDRAKEPSRAEYKSMMPPERHRQGLAEVPDMMARALVGEHLEIETLGMQRK
jgi:shikimate kinase